MSNIGLRFPADLHHKFLNDTDFRAAVQAVVLAMRRESKQHVKSTVQELGKLREQHVDVILWIVLTRKNKRFNFDNFFEQTRVKGFVLRTLVYAEGDDVTPAYVSWIDAHEEAYNTPDKYEARKAFVLLWSKLPAEWDILTWFEPSHWQRADFGTFFKRAAEMRREIKRAKAEGRIPLQIHVNKFRAAEEKLPNLLRKNAKKALKYSEDEPSGSSVISNKNAYTMKGLRHGLKASSHDGMLNKMADGMIRRTEGGAINKAVESYLAITLPLGEKLDVVLGVCTAGDDGEENMGL